MLSDLRFALRQLAKSPGFTAVAIVSLALGIGANTAVFSLVNAVLLQMLPVKNPQELVVFYWQAEDNVSPPSISGWTRRDPVSGKKTMTSFSVATFEQFREQATTLSDVFAFAPEEGFNVNIDGAAEIVSGTQVVSGNYHAGLGVTAAAGRLITPADDTLSAEAVAVISERFWQRRFGGDPAVIGKVISVNRVPVTIIGVTSSGFNGAGQVGEVTDLTLPLALKGRLNPREPDGGRNPDRWWIRIMGRLKPGVTGEQARASLEGVFHASARGHVNMRRLPGEPVIAPDQIPLPLLRIEPGGQGLFEARRDFTRSLNLLMGVVGLVLLIACANVANLLLARGAARRREIAVRLALGASRARIVFQLLAENMLLAALGAAAGLGLAVWGTRALIAMQPFGGAALEFDTSLDWRILGFTTGVALATSIVFGLAPALRATRLNLTAEFQGGVRSLGAGARSSLAKSIMVVQVALSLVLLVGAGLFVRTLRNLQRVDVGFNRERLLLFGVNATANGATGSEAVALYARMQEGIARLPGVRHAALARVAPLSRSNWGSGVNVPGYVAVRGESPSVNAVDPEYLPTMEIPLLQGRNFTAADSATAPKVALVNQAFARKYFGTENVVGRRIGFQGANDLNTEIVGLIRDAHYSGVKTAPPPTLLVLAAQLGGGLEGSVHFVVRFTGEAGAIMPAVQAAVRAIDPNLPLTNVRTQEQQIDRLFKPERAFANLCSFFGVLALVLAAVGLYGLLSYAVLRRTGEIGLRMALGALPGRVQWMILRESLGLVVLGVLLGIGAAAGATKWISSMLFGLSPTDPLTYLAVSTLLVGVATIASLIPARRAARVDPMTALRTE